MIFIDTHCHLDAEEFDIDRDSVIHEAKKMGVDIIVVPAVHISNFTKVRALSEKYSFCAYALGIHPIYVNQSSPAHLALLKTEIEKDLKENKSIVAVGEIGLDYFIEDCDKDCQEYYFVQQLKIARDFDLPVILHVRKSVDEVLKHLRKIKVRGGIAHAFNGSIQQAIEFVKLGFKLGFGGAMTYSRALKIRQLAVELPLDSIVLETDAPDIPPEWLGRSGRNGPGELIRIAQVFSDIRDTNITQVAEMTTNSALTALPGLVHLCTPPQVLL